MLVGLKILFFLSQPRLSDLRPFCFPHIGIRVFCFAQDLIWWDLSPSRILLVLTSSPLTATFPPPCTSLSCLTLIWGMKKNEFNFFQAHQKPNSFFLPGHLHFCVALWKGEILGRWWERLNSRTTLDWGENNFCFLPGLGVTWAGIAWGPVQGGRWQAYNLTYSQVISIELTQLSL